MLSDGESEQMPLSVDAQGSQQDPDKLYLNDRLSVTPSVESETGLLSWFTLFIWEVQERSRFFINVHPLHFKADVPHLYVLIFPTVFSLYNINLFISSYFSNNKYAEIQHSYDFV